MDAFARALLDPAHPPPAGLKTWNGSDPAARFAVYRNNVMVSLIDALADSFPVVAQLVGEDFFRAMAREYVRRHLPRSPVLAHYGDGFADFIAGFEPAASVPYLADVARLEYAYVQVFHGADTPALAPEALATCLNSPDQLPALRLRLRPGVQLVRSRHPIVSIWAAHHGQGELGTIDLDRAEAAFVVRPALSVEVIPLVDGAADFVTDLVAGLPLGSALERAQAQSSAFDLGAVFALLLRAQALGAIEQTPILIRGDT